MKKKVNRQTMSRIGRGTLITVLAGALSFLSSAPTTSRFSEPKPLPQPISYQQLLSEKTQTRPDVYFVLLSHPDVLTGDSNKEKNACLEKIAGIAHGLYEKYNSKSLLPEGLDPEFVNPANRGEPIALEDSGYDTPGNFFRKLENLINTRKWNLVTGEDREERAEYDAAKSLLHAAYAPPFKKAKDKLESPATTDPERIEIAEEANKEFETVWNTFFTPERTAQFYRWGISNRDERYAKACKRAKEEGRTPITVIYGSSHIYSFAEQLKANGLSYSIIKPNNVGEIVPMTPEKFREQFRLRINIGKKR